MPEQNKHNLLYFESSSMRELYKSMEDWQAANQKRLLSVSIEQDGGKFCCVALTNPLEVVITDTSGNPAVVPAQQNSPAYLFVSNL